MQRGDYGGGKPAPVPIFNHRKRQRQAVFADPGNSATSPPPNQARSNNAGGFQGGRQQSQYQTKPGSYTPAQKQKYSGPTCEYRGMPEPNARRTANVPNSSHMQGTGNKPISWGNQQQAQATASRGNYGNRINNNIGNSPTYSRSTHLSSQNQNQLVQLNQLQTKNSNQQQQFNRYQNQFGGSQTSSNYNSGSNQQNKRGGYNINNPTQNNSGNNRNNNHPLNRGYGGSNINNVTGGFGGNSHYGENNMQQNRAYGLGNNSLHSQAQKGGYGVTGNLCPSRTGGNYGGWGCAPPMASPIQGGMPPSPGNTFRNVAGAKPVYDGQSFGQNILSPSVPNPKNTSLAQVKKSTKLSDAKNKKQPTLRVLTASLSTMMKSAFLFEQLGPHMFEVFGVLDSAVVTDKTGTGKEFVLRDETSMAQCVFYEIDRHLPRLIRGQWQRCVGTVERRTNRFKCVSVRAAQGEERHLAKIGDEQTEQMLVSARRQTSEQ